MTDTITTAQMSALRDETRGHDAEMAAICDAALAGDADAIAECARVIAETDAQDAEEFGAITDKAIKQLADAVEYWAGRLGVYGFIGLRLQREPRAWAGMVIAGLTSEDPQVAAGAAQTVVEWSTSDDQIPDDWWATPCGVLVAATRAVDAGTWTHAEAAQVLGVSVATVGRWIDAGILEVDGVGPTGGRTVTRASVASRAAEN